MGDLKRSMQSGPAMHRKVDRIQVHKLDLAALKRAYQGV
jgi:hypothetical protein